MGDAGEKAASPRPPGPEAPLTLEEARERLRARGYLDRGVEGAVLKGALAARTRTRALVLGALVATLLLSVLLALVQAVLIAVASVLPIGDAALLFAWLLLGALVLGGAAVGLLMGAAWLRARGRGDGELASTEIGAAFGLVAGALGALAVAPAVKTAGPAGAAVVLVVVAGLVFLSVRVARSVAVTVWVASGRELLGRRGKAGALAALGAALLLVVVAGLLALRSAPPPEEPLVVRAGTARVVVVAVDGWSDRFVPESVAGEGLGGRALSYGKDVRDPAAFWTTVATGETVARHGVGSLDLVRVAGLSAPVVPAAGTGWYLGRVLPAFGAARRESVTSASRRVPAAWEVAHRGGVAALVVNWWTTYPATGPAGTVLSNHLFFAARARLSLAGEGWPPEAAVRAARHAPSTPPPASGTERRIADARGLDAFALRAFEEELSAGQPRLSMLYLPGLDILSQAMAEPSLGAADRVALATALTEEAETIRSFLSGPAVRRADLAVLLLDGGRESGAGRAVLLGPLARPGPSGEIRPVDVAPTVLSALGIPASREVSGRVRADLLAEGAAARGSVASWGRRRVSSAPPVDSREYVENLRSLGYLK